MRRCKPQHSWKGTGQCRKCGIFKKGSVERYVMDFWAKVNRATGCWTWKSHYDGDGYAVYSVRGTRVKASRMMWVVQGGSLPPDREICHSCDNRGCVNPEHLFLATHRENIQDMMRKDRKGSKLKRRDVASILLHLESGWTHKELAKKWL